MMLALPLRKCSTEQDATTAVVPVLPDVSGSVTLYALAGMGAVAAAVLGAPISTTLIVFELTGDWQTGLAVMVSVSISTARGTAQRS